MSLYQQQQHQHQQHHHQQHYQHFIINTKSNKQDQESSLNLLASMKGRGNRCRGPERPGSLLAVTQKILFVFFKILLNTCAIVKYSQKLEREVFRTFDFLLRCLMVAKQIGTRLSWDPSSPSIKPRPPQSHPSPPSEALESLPFRTCMQILI